MTCEEDAMDTDELVAAIAKTVAEFNRSQNGVNWPQIVEQLMCEIDGV